MKLLVVSDSHHSLGYIYDAIELEMPDAVIHLGDHQGDAEDLSCAFEAIPFYTVPGNCDYGSIDPDTRLLAFEGVRFFLTHGHRYGVKSGLTRLWLAAKQAGADIALYGHTHIPSDTEKDGIRMINPGAGFYAVIQIQNGHFTCVLHRE